jgi:hypothetical protein
MSLIGASGRGAVGRLRRLIRLVTATTTATTGAAVGAVAMAIHAGGTPTLPAGTAVTQLVASGPTLSLGEPAAAQDPAVTAVVATGFGSAGAVVRIAVSWTESTGPGDEAVLVSVLGPGGQVTAPQQVLTGDALPLVLPGASFYDFPGEITVLPGGVLVVAAPLWWSPPPPRRNGQRSSRDPRQRWLAGRRAGHPPARHPRQRQAAATPSGRTRVSPGLT